MSLMSTFTNASINGWRAISSAGTPSQTGTIIQSPPVANNQFGYNCVISGNGMYAVIVSWKPISPFPVVYYVYLNNLDGTWSLQTTLYSTTTNAAGFPISINYTGEYIALSNPNIPNYNIKIYHRIGSTWSLQQTITTSAILPLGGFDNTGTYLTVGRANYSSNRGAVDVYTRVGTVWTLTNIVSDPSIPTNSAIGGTLSISGNGNYIVAASNLAGYSQDVYIFNGLGSWALQQKLTGAFPTNSNNLKMNNDGDRFCFGYTGAGAVPGYAKVYARNITTWSLNSTLVGGNIANEYFGTDIDMDSTGDNIIVAAPRATVSGSTIAGTIYAYSKVGSTYIGTNINSTPVQSNAFFGHSIAISGSGEIIMGSAIGMTVSGFANAGEIFIFGIS